MKQLQKESDMTSEIECATLLMEVVPQVMQHIRSEMRSNRMSYLSVPQLRTLIYLSQKDGVSLSEVAEHVGLKLPSMSKIIDAMVDKKLVIRRAFANDRRYISLRLSAHGSAELRRTRRSTEARLAETIVALPTEQQARVIEALKMLGQVFAPETASADKGGR